MRRCKNPNCKKIFTSTNKRKKYCSQNCCVFATSKKRTKDEDSKYLDWHGIKIFNGALGKTFTTKDVTPNGNL